MYLDSEAGAVGIHGLDHCFDPPLLRYLLEGLGFRVQGLGFGVWSLGLRL